MDTKRKKSVPSVQERRISFILMAVLIMIGVVIFTLQSRFDSAQWRDQSSVEGHLPRTEETTAPLLIDIDGVPGLQPLSPLEQYQADNLSDKINGKAELYLSAGFIGLESRRFSMNGEPGRWLERCVYDMGDHRNAFSVFSTQQRQNIQPLETINYGYVAANGLFLVHGQFYVEIIAAEVSEAMDAKMKALAQTFIDAHDVAFDPIAELTLFPEQDRRRYTLTLTAANAFGLQGLDWVYSAQYRRGQVEVSAFISKRASAQEAQALAQAFAAYWGDYGGETLEPSEKLPQARIVSILDNYEIVLTRGVYLFGIHEATHLEYAIDLATQLNTEIGEALN